jgi:hypothetical protein
MIYFNIRLYRLLRMRENDYLITQRSNPYLNIAAPIPYKQPTSLRDYQITRNFIHDMNKFISQLTIYGSVALYVYVPLVSILKLCILLTDCVCEFHIVLIINSDTFPKQH